LAIPEQWDQLVRVAASLKNRVCPAHVVVQRLANSSPSDRLAKALTMLGRVVKTIYIPKYFNEEDLRHRVQLQLNRGEHRHSVWHAGSSSPTSENSAPGITRRS
jgi:TnpA family transposase